MVEVKPKKRWYKRWWAITIWIFLGLAFLAALTPETPTTNTQPAATQPDQTRTPTLPETTQEQPKKSTTSPQTPAPTKPEYDLEMTTREIFNEFKDLSELQIEEKVKEFKGKRIKTSVYADKIDKASLSSQYVVMQTYEYPYNLLPVIKAFFPKEEKDNLLKINLGSKIIFSGEFVNYNKGNLKSYVEFTNSRFIEVQSKEQIELNQIKNKLDLYFEKYPEDKDLFDEYMPLCEVQYNSSDNIKSEVQLKTKCMDDFYWDISEFGNTNRIKSNMENLKKEQGIKN